MNHGPILLEVLVKICWVWYDETLILRIDSPKNWSWKEMRSNKIIHIHVSKKHRSWSSRTVSISRDYDPWGPLHNSSYCNISRKAHRDSPHPNFVKSTCSCQVHQNLGRKIMHQPRGLLKPQGIHDSLKTASCF